MQVPSSVLITVFSFIVIHIGFLAYAAVREKSSFNSFVVADLVVGRQGLFFWILLIYLVYFSWFKLGKIVDRAAKYQTKHLRDDFLPVFIQSLQDSETRMTGRVQDIVMSAERVVDKVNANIKKMIDVKDGFKRTVDTVSNVKKFLRH